MLLVLLRRLLDNSALFGLLELFQTLFTLSLLALLVDRSVTLFLGQLGVYGRGC